MHQVETGINQGAIEIEDDQFDGVRIKGTADATRMNLQNKARRPEQPSHLSS